MKRPLLLMIFGLLFTGMVNAQNHKPDYKKLHYLSEQEMSIPVDWSRDFTPTDPPEGNIRNVAEFDPMQSVLVRYPFGIPVELIREMAEDTRVTTIVANASQQQTVINTYTNNNVNLSNCDFLIAQTDSYWVRDYGPWFVFDGNKSPGIVDFPYNRPRPNDNNIPARVAESLGINLFGMNLISTGGNYMCDGMGKAASTDLVWEENPSLTQTQVSNFVLDYLGNSPYMVLADPLGEYIKHIDCWGKFLSPGKVMIGQVPETDSRYQDYEDAAAYFANTVSSWGVPYEVVRVFTPGTYPYTPYTNSLILNKKVLVPITGSQWDDEALAVYEEAMPGYEIIGIMYDGWENTDALHCRTKGVADLGMLYISHIPILGEVNYSNQYTLNADVYAYSGEPVYNDSVCIHYRVNEGDYQVVTMSYQQGDTYSGVISGINQGDLVEYYLSAVDMSGRHSFAPPIGEPDPFVFDVDVLPGLAFHPDSVYFENGEQMFEGIPLHIVNTDPSSSILVSQITELGDQFPWLVEEMPQLPLLLPAGDSISLVIQCPVVTKQNTILLTDSLFVTTGSGVFGTQIIINDSLLVGIDESFVNQSISVGPNPASGYLYVEGVPADSQAEISLFALNGNRVANYILEGTGSAININLPVGLSSGTYVYKLRIGTYAMAGKIVIHHFN